MSSQTWMEDERVLDLVRATLRRILMIFIRGLD